MFINPWHICELGFRYLVCHSLIYPRRMCEGYRTWFVINPRCMREGSRDQARIRAWYILRAHASYINVN